MTFLTFTHLHFCVLAESDMVLGEHHAGNDFRNAWANVIRHSTCVETNRREAPSPEHVANCPACWFISAENQPGSVVRPYAFVPPQPPRRYVAAGTRLSFGLTLFGPAHQFLPYVILAAAEMGRVGIGPGRREGAGRFRIETIRSHNPLTGETHDLFSPGDSVVHITPAEVSIGHTLDHALSLAEQLRRDGTLRIRFLSPLRLEKGNRLFKSPDFAVFFRRLLYRLDDLARQYAGGERRDRGEVSVLNAAAERVRLVEARTRWIELDSWSGRKGQRTPFSGLVGEAVYQTSDWIPLLPWLLFGQGTQVGKSVVKGNGVFELVDLAPGYWSWMRSGSC